MTRRPKPYPQSKLYVGATTCNPAQPSPSPFRPSFLPSFLSPLSPLSPLFPNEPMVECRTALESRILGYPPTRAVLMLMVHCLLRFQVAPTGLLAAGWLSTSHSSIVQLADGSLLANIYAPWLRVDGWNEQVYHKVQTPSQQCFASIPLPLS